MNVRGTQFPIFAFKVNQKRYSYIDLIDRKGKKYFTILLRLAWGYGDFGEFYKLTGTDGYPISRSTFSKYKDVNTYLHDDIKYYTIKSVFLDRSEKAIKGLK